MNRFVGPVLFATALVGAAVIGLPSSANAEPIPIDLQRLPVVPVEVWNDINASGSHDFGDTLLATTWTDLQGAWAVTGLPVNHTHRTIVFRVPGAHQGLRIGGDLQRWDAYGFTPINGVPVKLWSDSQSPTTYFGPGDNLIASDTTRCLGPGECGDFRLQGVNTAEVQGIVLAVSGTPASYSGYRGWLWDATYDDN